ncbi:MAG: stage V sporulation protein S, partial [Methanomassiliicoccales archaeon]
MNEDRDVQNGDDVIVPQSEIKPTELVPTLIPLQDSEFTKHDVDHDIPDDIPDASIIKEESSTTASGQPLANLRVKADPPDISPDDRKRNVKKLAGAISHALRSSGEINVRAFGNAAIGKAAKALAIAKDYIGVQNLQLSFSPAFISTTIGDHDLTGICFCTFASEKSSEDNVDISNVQNILMVKADPKDILADDRKKNVKRLAGAIA